MIKRIIERPVLATVISIIIVILGIVGLLKLPLTQFPDIAPPSVSVSAVFPGGNADAVMRSVITPIEEAINGVENMTYIQSAASNDGSGVINVFFKLGTNPDQAAVNVQNRVAQVTGQLPPEVIQAGITTVKQQNGMIMIVDIYSEDSKKFDETFLQNYARINVTPALKRVTGVGNVQIFGTKDYAIRIWLNPQQLATYHLSPQEVLDAIRDQSLEAAPGSLGESTNEAMQYVIKYAGKFNTPEQYENIVIRAENSGNNLLLKDLARVEFGSANYSVNNRTNGKHCVTMAVFQTTGSNANEIQTKINGLLEQMEPTFPKGVKSHVSYSTKRQLDASISQVQNTLIEAFVLVFIIVFLFLQDFRSTLIPAIAVPVSLIGTFFFLQMLGFSINMLTLFALVLAIGIVVDDAIVVVEAVHSNMEKTHQSAKAATTQAMSEITGAIVSITLVMTAVFVPVGFMEGSTGVFYRQFAFTLAIAILISALNALTLSPVLCALLLKNNHAENASGKPAGFRKRFFSAFNSGFDAVTGKYVRSVGFLVKNKWLSLGALAVVSVVAFWLMNSTPKGFIPSEDDNFAAFAVALPPGASLARTSEVIRKADSILQKEPAIFSTTIISGFNMLGNNAGSAYATGFINLRSLEERGEVKDIDKIVIMLGEKLSTIQDANFSVFTMPTVPGFGTFDGLEFVLQDRESIPIEKFNQVAHKFIGEISKRKEVAQAFTMFNASFPQYELVVDQIKAKQLGVRVSDLMMAMQIYYGSVQANDFNRFGKYYRVYMQADAPFRANESSLDGIFVKNATGQMVPVSTLASFKKIYGPESINRYNLFNSIAINASPAPGFSTGDAMLAIEEVASKTLGTGFTYEWTGLSKEQKESGNQMVFIFALVLLFVYFLLSAQYESYLLPLAVLFSLPVGVIGVFTAVKLAGLDNNIYVQVGLIMLIGLLAKNAILIIEFGVQRRRAGKTLVEAALEAAKLRLRPILMTSLAFIAGLIPLMNASGPSAVGNISISIGTASGMLTGVVLGVFIIPVLFIVFQYLQEKVSIKKI
ncbi:efflux RND transporter permease subunit [Emticicia sp. CRIBPO]|uniref:efflux RND transporter permease subunit n=1 Tax=Emticicia sp. CRIBPO TaxID=2683258 RepID=UPI001413110D|nr:efflux RND transporter permease subunit [Emticicia sp. CRIBPO]NBA85509.1 efflux RND transporter permease subunit [Emticicia sp. CRIBPO]